MKNINNMKKSKYKILIFLMLLLFSLIFSACKKEDNKEDDIDWSQKEILNFEVVNETIEKYYEYDEFTIDMIKFKVTYTDDTSREIPLSEEMISEKDLNKLKNAGNPKIYVTYDIFETYIHVHLVDSALLDEDLNKDGSYNAVIKAIRDKSTNKINFILEKSNGVKALQFKYICDGNIMTLSDATKNSSLNGLFLVNANNDMVTATIILDNIETTEILLFSVAFEGNFRTSNLRIDDTFNNAIYTQDENLQPIELTSILYHASIK